MSKNILVAGMPRRTSHLITTGVPVNTFSFISAEDDDDTDELPPDPKETDLDAGTGEGEGIEKPLAKPAEPDKFDKFQDTIAGVMGKVDQTLEIVRQSIAKPAEKPLETPKRPDFEARIAEAEEEGDIRKVLQLTRQQTKFDIEESRRVAAEQIEQVRAVGINTISNLVQEVAAAKLPKYDKYKKEINDHLTRMSPEARLNPEMVKIAHDLVVGQNMENIVTEAVEAALRSARAGGAPTDLRGGRRGGGRAAGVPSAAELFGESAAAALLGSGKDEETFAQRLGYESWAAYVEMYKNQ